MICTGMRTYIKCYFNIIKTHVLYPKTLVRRETHACTAADAPVDMNAALKKSDDYISCLGYKFWLDRVWQAFFRFNF